MSTSESGILPSSPRNIQLLTWRQISLTPCTLFLKYTSLHPLFVKLSLVSICIILRICVLANLFIRRVINSLFLVLLFQRQGPYQMILLLLHLKPPRLMKVRTKMISKNWKMRLARRHRFLLHLLTRMLSTRKGSVSMKLLPRVLRRLVKPPLKWKTLNTSTC
jgi:hypothetical protein